MMNLFELTINFIETGIVIGFLSLYFGFKYTGLKKYICLFLGIAGATCVITALNVVYIYEGLMGLLLVVTYSLYAHMCLKGDLLTKVFISSCIDCIVCMTSLISFLLVSLASGQDCSYVVASPYERGIFILLAKILLVCVCGILLKFKLKSVAHNKGVIFVVVLALIIEYMITHITRVSVEYRELKLEMLTIAFAIALVIGLTYYIFISSSYNAQLQNEYFALKRKQEYDKAHADEIKNLYEKNSALRHDLKVYFTNALIYLDENTSKAKKYIESVINDKVVLDNFEVETGNRCLDAIITSKISLCKKEDIFIHTNIQRCLLEMLSDDEIGIIFGNLFDNAIEAAVKTNDKIVELNVQKKGKYNMIIMKNSIEKSVLKENSELTTTKKDKNLHGFGVKNIRNIVKSHGGLIDYYEENNGFICQILIPVL